MTRVLISVGSNQNGPETQILRAIGKLSEYFSNLKTSALYLTEPVGSVIQDAFVNAAISFETDRTAPEVLRVLLDIESQAGRNRQTETPKGPRALDLDMIFFGSEIWSDESLEIPHPRYQDRRFVLEPANEVAPDYADPLTGKTITQTLESCQDTNWVKPLEQKVLAG